MVQSPFVVDIVVETAPPGVAVMFLMDWEAAQSAAVDQRRLAPSSHKWWITLWASMLIGAKVFFFLRRSERLKTLRFMMSLSFHVIPGILYIIYPVILMWKPDCQGLDS